MNVKLLMNTSATPDVSETRLRPQDDKDVAALEKFCPFDQSRQVECTWIDGELVFAIAAPKPKDQLDPVEAKVEAEFDRVRNMPEAEAKEAAAMAGVKWDGRASLETMKRRIAAAKNTEAVTA